MRHALLAAAAFALTGCATPMPGPYDPPLPPTAKDTCGAAQYASLIGKPATAPGVPANSRMMRHIRPDTVVTMDLSPMRVNLGIDKDDIIRAVSCG